MVGEWAVAVTDEHVEARRQVTDAETEVHVWQLSPQDTSRGLRQWAAQVGANISADAMADAMRQVAAMAADALAVYDPAALIPEATP
ncbi:hypothetical protein [Propionibacterium australiense]|uniref:Uncharacterized protein n=1 Tax=Propionibacterium australiense TaxID=119981 RepID=A0A8B3FP31_9ACTN|nr:hypothetical protein [Propionibacterium australiense]RLP08922.1 hypothetical protein D7U36_08930 [Propionibacterium australiense]